jgi:glucose/arabinose dehydrogenase
VRLRGAGRITDRGPDQRTDLRLIAEADRLADPATECSPPRPFDPTAITLASETVVGGLENPLDVTHAGDGSGRIFVAEQTGRIRIVRDGALADRPFLDIRGRTRAGGERGLLGIAFHPRYPVDPRVFVNYTDRNGDTVVSWFPVRPDDPDVADPDAERVILSIDQPFGNHNGGALAFGPDGALYVSTGDGGGGGDPIGAGQRLDTLLGKILRIDVDAEPASGLAYAIPPDNPFVGRADARAEIWAFGLRNPWRISFDRATGDLWIGDVGQGRYEEIDVIPVGVGGLNFGWNLMEGFHCYPSGDGCLRDGLTLPVAEYDHDFGCSVTGGVVYRGVAQPLLVGGYLFADSCSGNVWLLDASLPEGAGPVLTLGSGRNISGFGEDEAGEVYATDIASGELLRIVAAPR